MRCCVAVASISLSLRLWADIFAACCPFVFGGLAMLSAATFNVLFFLNDMKYFWLSLVEDFLYGGS